MIVVDLIKSTGQYIGDGILNKLGDVASYLGFSTRFDSHAEPRIPAASDQPEPPQTPVKQRTSSPVAGLTIPTVSKKRRRELLKRKYYPGEQAFQDASKLRGLDPGKRFKLNTLAGYQHRLQELVDWHEDSSDAALEADLKSALEDFLNNARDFLQKKQNAPELTSARFLADMGYDDNSPRQPPPVDHETFKQRVEELYHPSAAPQPPAEPEPSPTSFFHFDGDVIQIEADKLQPLIVSRLTNTWHPWEDALPELPVINQSRLDPDSVPDYAGAVAFTLTLSKPDEAYKERVNGILKTMPAFYRDDKNSLTRFQNDMQSYLEMSCQYLAGLEVPALSPEALKVRQQHEEKLNSTLAELSQVGLPVVDEAIEHLRLQKAVMEQFKALFVTKVPPTQNLG
ncbi:MAG: hypothetical protein ACR2PT_03430 [Endozoicomonas sp.]